MLNFQFPSCLLGFEESWLSYSFSSLPFCWAYFKDLKFLINSSCVLFTTAGLEAFFYFMSCLSNIKLDKKLLRNVFGIKY